LLWRIVSQFDERVAGHHLFDFVLQLGQGQGGIVLASGIDLVVVLLLVLEK
jgi:hypothetical protein